MDSIVLVQRVLRLLMCVEDNCTRILKMASTDPSRLGSCQNNFG